MERNRNIITSNLTLAETIAYGGPETATKANDILLKYNILPARRTDELAVKLARFIVKHGTEAEKELAAIHPHKDLFASQIVDKPIQQKDTHHNCCGSSHFAANGSGCGCGTHMNCDGAGKTCGNCFPGKIRNPHHNVDGFDNADGLSDSRSGRRVHNSQSIQGIFNNNVLLAVTAISITAMVIVALNKRN